MFAQVNGIKLFYEYTACEAAPAPDGRCPAFLLLHGNGEDHTIFDKLALQLAQNYHVYAIDTRGHGKSEKVTQYHYADMMQDIAAFIEELQLKQPLLYGFSDGGIVGLSLAIRYPTMLSKLVVSGANLNPAGLKRNFLWLMKGLYFFSRNPKIKLMLEEPNITKEELQKIAVPTLVLAGAKDIVRQSHTEELARDVQDSRLQILPGEDHASYVVHSEKLYGVMAPFLRKDFAEGINY